MALDDKVAAAKKIDAFLRSVVANAELRFNYRITENPTVAEDSDWEKPEIMVDLSGPDSDLLLDRGAELLRSLEHLVLEMLRVPGQEHERVTFDCMNYRAMRLEELTMAADVAAERVRKTGTPYEFSPMSSRER